MTLLPLNQKADRVIRFVIVQCIALIGWIVVQSFFSLSPLGRSLPFTLLIIVEAVWWIALLIIMLLLFIREYRRFVQSALELEKANRKLKEVTNQLLQLERSRMDSKDSSKGE